MATETLRCFIREDSLLAKLTARKMGTRNMAVTVGRTVYLYNASRREFLNNPRWVCHEICHLLQFRKYGWLRFLCLYGWESLRYGYPANRYEKEALQAENDPGLLQKVEFQEC